MVDKNVNKSDHAKKGAREAIDKAAGVAEFVADKADAITSKVLVSVLLPWYLPAGS